MPYTVKRYRGESLSSWLFRLKMTDVRTTVLMDASTRDMDVVADMAEWDTRCEETTLCIDPDFTISDSAEACLRQRFGILPKHVARDFATFRSLIPLRHRGAYCYECMALAIGETGFPICLTQWRHVLEPFCNRHRLLLREGLIIGRGREDLPRRLFKWHWNSERQYDGYEQYMAADARLLALSSRVQFKLNRSLAGQSDLRVKFNIENFVLTLMRALMMPCLNASYGRVLAVSGRTHAIKFCMGQSHYTALYAQPFRASSGTRARALYLTGLLLGWISESEAKRAAGTDFFISTSAADVLRNLRRSHMGLIEWMKIHLQRFETDVLRVSTLRNTCPNWD